MKDTGKNQPSNRAG